MILRARDNGVSMNTSLLSGRCHGSHDPCREASSRRCHGSHERVRLPPREPSVASGARRPFEHEGNLVATVGSMG